VQIGREKLLARLMWSALWRGKGQASNSGSLLGVATAKIFIDATEPVLSLGQAPAG